MFQDGQIAPAPSGGTPPYLRVVLLALNKDGERDEEKDRYAVIRFPQSYEAAITAIERNLEEYLPGGKADSIEIFCQMRSIKDKWIWAKADRDDWNLVQAELALTANPLGIRPQKYVQNNEAPKPVFIRGPIMLTYAEKKGGTSHWTSISPSFYNRCIDRPSTYLEARDSILAAVSAYPLDWPVACRTVARHALSNLQFKFYYFISNGTNGPNTKLWVDFPASAYRNGEIWRATVPEPNGLLGFTLEHKQ